MIYFFIDNLELRSCILVFDLQYVIEVLFLLVLFICNGCKNYFNGSIVYILIFSIIFVIFIGCILLMGDIVKVDLLLVNWFSIILFINGVIVFMFYVMGMVLLCNEC